MGRTHVMSPPRRVAAQPRRRPTRSFFVSGSPQSITITGSGGIVIGGTGVTSSSVYGPGASGYAAPARGRRVG